MDQCRRPRLVLALPWADDSDWTATRSPCPMAARHRDPGIAGARAGSLPGGIPHRTRRIIGGSPDCAGIESAGRVGCAQNGVDLARASDARQHASLLAMPAGRHRYIGKESDNPEMRGVGYLQCVRCGKRKDPPSYGVMSAVALGRGGG